MRRLTSFTFVSLDGYYKGSADDISWHRHGSEEREFSKEGLETGNTLLFGRVTYQMMAAFWPSPDAIQNMPVIANGMNNADKIVFSKTLQQAEWNNTRIIADNIVNEMIKLKQLPGKGMTILGSGSILTQFAEAGLIDEYQVMIDPVAIGEGTPLFKGLNYQMDLQLTSSRIFKSGAVLLCYQPLK